MRRLRYCGDVHAVQTPQALRDTAIRWTPCTRLAWITKVVVGSTMAIPLYRVSRPLMVRALHLRCRDLSSSGDPYLVSAQLIHGAGCFHRGLHLVYPLCDLPHWPHWFLQSPTAADVKLWGSRQRLCKDATAAPRAGGPSVPDGDISVTCWSLMRSLTTAAP